MVSAAVAGDDLQAVARAASAALGCPVAISLPALGAPVIGPPGTASPEAIQRLVALCEAIIAGARSDEDAPNLVPIRIGEDVVGIVTPLGERPRAREHRSWLEAAAAAAAVTALISAARNGDIEDARRAFVLALMAAPPADVGAMISQARRLGLELEAGAVAICAWPDSGTSTPAAGELPGLFVEIGEQRLIGLLPAEKGLTVAAELETQGAGVALSSARRDPAALHDALREAELMAELLAGADAPVAGQDHTYRLLIGVLLRDADELEHLRAQTVLPLARYDGEHDTELVATLKEFLAHHGSTTETADAMGLHRHTVGYRLARVHEVAGLSPYESGGRERLGLGLKADQILLAAERCVGQTWPTRPALSRVPAPPPRAASADLRRPAAS